MGYLKASKSLYKRTVHCTSSVGSYKLTSTGAKSHFSTMEQPFVRGRRCPNHASSLVPPEPLKPRWKSARPSLPCDSRRRRDQLRCASWRHARLCFAWRVLDRRGRQPVATSSAALPAAVGTRWRRASHRRCRCHPGCHRGRRRRRPCVDIMRAH